MELIGGTLRINSCVPKFINELLVEAQTEQATDFLILWAWHAAHCS